MRQAYTYRIATAADIPAIVALVNGVNYFQSYDESMAGQWVLAESAEGIQAVAWFFYQGPQAYIDYWTGKPIAATMLLLYLHQLLQQNGVRYVRAAVDSIKCNAANVAASLGMELTTGYYLAFKDFEWGTKQ